MSETITIVTSDGRVVSGTRRTGGAGAQAGDRGRCSSCGADIVWHRTSSGRPMPCNPAILSLTTPNGDVEVGRVSHFATCPNAGKHRRRTRRGG